MTVLTDRPELRDTLARACRILARKGLVFAIFPAALLLNGALPV